MGKLVKVGFHEKCLEKYIGLLVENGYKVAVVEQVEKYSDRAKGFKSNRAFRKHMQNT